jgi:hypothetical protein
MAALKLAEIADRIFNRLKALEARGIMDHGGLKRFYLVNAFPAGAYVGVIYVSYQGPHYLRRDRALRLLAWLEAGHDTGEWAIPKDWKAPIRTP